MKTLRAKSATATLVGVFATWLFACGDGVRPHEHVVGPIYWDISVDDLARTIDLDELDEYDNHAYGRVTLDGQELGIHLTFMPSRHLFSSRNLLTTVYVYGRVDACDMDHLERTLVPSDASVEHRYTARTRCTPGDITQPESRNSAWLAPWGSGVVSCTTDSSGHVEGGEVCAGYGFGFPPGDNDVGDLGYD